MLKNGIKLPHIDKIFVLNLKHRTDRLSFQKKQFWDLGIEPFVRVEPVVFDEPNNFLNKSIRSVYSSHLKIIKQALDEDINALVLEDDALIKNFYKVKKCLNFLFNKINDWDMFYFYNLNNFLSKKENTIFRYGDICKIKQCVNLHAYIINKKKLNFVYNTLDLFKNKIENLEKKCDWRSHIDQVFMFVVHPYMNVYGAHEDLIIQDRKSFKSDNPWV